MLTRSILAGKWWGTFRQVGPVLFWPALLSAGLLLQFGNWPQYLLLIGVILGYGAVMTSLGLALATWMSRLGRAIALCVTAYVVSSIGWPILIALTWKESSGPGLLMGCPAIGTFFATALVGPDRFGPRVQSEDYQGRARDLDDVRSRAGGGPVRQDVRDLRPSPGTDARDEPAAVLDRAEAGFAGTRRVAGSAAFLPEGSARRGTGKCSASSPVTSPRDARIVYVELNLLNLTF